MPNQAKDDKVTPKVAQPPVVKYKVQKDDTFTSLGNPQAIMALNPGVPKLSTGQVIQIPNPQASPFPVSNNPFLNQTNIHTQAPLMGQPSQPIAQGSFVSGNGNVNMTGQHVGFQTPTTNGFMAPQLTGGSFYSGSGQVNLTGVVAGGGGGQNGATGTTGAPPRPEGVYTGGSDANSQAWRDYWNYMARHPQEAAAQANYINQQKRKSWGGGGSTGYNYSNGSNYNVTNPTSIGNNVVTASWRVG